MDSIATNYTIYLNPYAYLPSNLIVHISKKKKVKENWFSHSTIHIYNDLLPLQHPRTGCNNSPQIAQN